MDIVSIGHWNVSESFQRRMAQQARSTFAYQARNYPSDTRVLSEGFARAFPLDADDTFDDLIVAIDKADQETRQRNDRR